MKPSIYGAYLFGVGVGLLCGLVLGGLIWT